MKNLLKPKRKFKFSLKLKLFIILFVLLFVIAGINEIWKAMDRFYSEHYFQRNQIISITLKKPIEIKKREPQVKEIVKVVGEVPEPKDLHTNAEKYIYEVFGIENYKIAISIAKAESGLREDAININTNNTIDVGIFQINSIHFKKEFCTLKDVVTIKGNVDCAYQIYKASGWNPWVAFNNGNFTATLH